MNPLNLEPDQVYQITLRAWSLPDHEIINPTPQRYVVQSPKQAPGMPGKRCKYGERRKHYVRVYDTQRDVERLLHPATIQQVSEETQF